MSLLTEREQKYLDVDWYCVINDVPVHIASMGGKIPEAFCERNDLRLIQDKIVSLPDICDVEIDGQYVQSVVSNGYQYIQRLGMEDFIKQSFSEFTSFTYGDNRSIEERFYTFSFIQKAKKGFYSFARIDETPTYKMIARPLVAFDWRNSDVGLVAIDGLFPDFPNTIDIV